MDNNLFPSGNINYRAIYGKLFSGLLTQFGVNYIAEIEDAIQNSFLKSLKIWNWQNMPNNLENWLFIVARNDLLNQIKKQKNDFLFISENSDLIVNNDLMTNGRISINNEIDLRFQTIVFISLLKSVSKQSKIIFILKNIFGLSTVEICDSILISQDAIYKNLNRTKKAFKLEFNGHAFDINEVYADQQAILLIEEVLYAVYNVGFDSFNDKTKSIINKDLCLEALALAKLLFTKYQYSSTSNLVALFCFHTARFPSKIENGKLIPFFKQNRNEWNKELINFGFAYLKEPDKLSKFYLEAILLSKYMSSEQLNIDDWMAIEKLYELILLVSSSPIVKLNYCYCLAQVGKLDYAINILSDLELELPPKHIYFSLVKAKLLKNVNPKESEDLFFNIMDNMNQLIRKDYLVENEIISFS